MKKSWPLSVLLAVLLLAVESSTGAQTSSTSATIAQQSSSSAAQVDFKSWNQRTDPFHIVGPIYYVGTRGLGVYLITSSAGHMLLGGAVPGASPLIDASIRKLGFKTEDIRILLLNHAHFDHAGTLADMKRLTGGKVEAMDADVELLKSGGKTDYLYANEPEMHFAPVTADHVLKDGEVVSLGDVQLTAHRTPGHTPGCTTWTTTVEEGGRSYFVVFPDCTTVNPGTHLVQNPSYPGIADDYRHTFSVLQSLHPDIFLSYHAEFFDPAGKRARAATEGVQAWVDPEGYRRRITATEARFEELLAKEGGSSATTSSTTATSHLGTSWQFSSR